MSRNGSGVYSLPAGNPVVTGTTISSSWANTTLSDIATALTGSVAADGQTAMTGNLQMGNNKVTGLAVATASGDALSYGQAATISALTVTGAFAANGGATLGDASGDALTINSSAVSIPNGLNFGSNNLVLSGGNVGIGTSSPDTKLNVVSSDNTQATDIIRVSSNNELVSLGIGYDTIRCSTLRFETGSTPSERMRIDSSGNVGIGTASPSSQLELKNGLPFLTINGTTLSGNRGIAMQYNGTTGGYLTLDTTSGEFALTAGTPTSTGYYLTFKTNNGTERMRIDSSGNLLVGTTNTSISAGAGFKFIGNPSEPYMGIVTPTNGSGNTNYHLYSTGAGAMRFYVGSNGQIFATSTSITAISDATLKENVRNLETGLSEILALQPRRFDWKNGDGNDVAGFIAQEVEQVLPELVYEYKYNSDETKKAIKMGDILPTLVKAIQEQQAIITDLTNRLTALENK